MIESMHYAQIAGVIAGAIYTGASKFSYYLVPASDVIVWWREEKWFENVISGCASLPCPKVPDAQPGARPCGNRATNSSAFSTSPPDLYIQYGEPFFQCQISTRGIADVFMAII
jgi:hypothetical protein